MEISDMTYGLIIGISGSLMAAAITSKYRNIRQRNITRKIQELDYEEKFLEKISKGNIELLRSCFKIMFLCLGIFGCAAGIIVFSIAIQPLVDFTYHAMMFGSAALFAGGIGAFMHTKTLMKLNNLSKTKILIESQRAKLNQKLK